MRRLEFTDGSLVADNKLQVCCRHDTKQLWQLAKSMPRTICTWLLCQVPHAHQVRALHCPWNMSKLLVARCCISNSRQCSKICNEPKGQVRGISCDLIRVHKLPLCALFCLHLLCEGSLLRCELQSTNFLEKGFLAMTIAFQISVKLADFHCGNLAYPIGPSNRVE